jgi:hypothetical protein
MRAGSPLWLNAETAGIGTLKEAFPDVQPALEPRHREAAPEFSSKDSPQPAALDDARIFNSPVLADRCRQSPSPEDKRCDALRQDSVQRENRLDDDPPDEPMQR